MGAEDTNTLKILTNWDKAKQAVALCQSIDELQDIRNKHLALKAYAKQAQESLEVQNNIAEIKLRAERRIGEFSRQLETKERLRTDLRSTAEPEVQQTKTNILQEAGIRNYRKYEAIASLPEEEFEKHIDNVKKSNEELTTLGVIKAARKYRNVERENELRSRDIVKPSGKYEVLYCDPPWRYEFTEAGNREVENHYPTMLLEDIKALDVPAADNCVLLMWSTAPKLDEALEVIRAWGFTYRTCAVWDKGLMGMGYWFRGQHELLLVAVKGQPRTPTPEGRVTSVYQEKRGKHSQKPLYYYGMIESMFPNRSYCELFARGDRDGWYSWGYEAQRLSA